MSKPGKKTVKKAVAEAAESWKLYLPDPDAETFPDYLRRVGRDFQATEDTYGNDEKSPTAQDYFEAAKRLDEIYEACGALFNRMLDGRSYADYDTLDGWGAELGEVMKKARDH